MKILYIITQADGGGAQKYTLELAKHFQGSIAAGDEAQQLFQDAAKFGIQTHRLKHLKRNIHVWHDCLAIFEIRSLIKTHHPDIVHVNSTKAGFLGSVAGKLAGVKVVFTAHGFRFLEPISPLSRKFYQFIEKVGGFFRDHTIAVSEIDKNAALENNLVSPNKISVIHNCIGPVDFLPKEQARERLGLGNEKIIIGAIANDYPTKGLDILANAGPITGAQTVVIGKMGKQITKSDANIFLGYRPAAATFLKAFDVLVVPSRKEGFPFVVLEAMLAGLPIVATKVGGIPEALDEAGILVEPENPSALAKALQDLIANPALLRELSHKALQRSKLFTEEQMFKETNKVYQSVLQN